MVEVFITFNLKEAPTWGLALFHSPPMASATLAKSFKDACLFAFVCIYKEKRRDQFGLAVSTLKIPHRGEFLKLKACPAQPCMPLHPAG